MLNSELKMVEVTVDGRRYLVAIMPKDTPMYQQRVWRIRKDGSRGQQLQGWGGTGAAAVIAAHRQERAS